MSDRGLRSSAPRQARELIVYNTISVRVPGNRPGSWAQAFQAVGYRRITRKRDGLPIWRRAPDAPKGPIRKKRSEARELSPEPFSERVHHNAIALMVKDLGMTSEEESLYRLLVVNLDDAAPTLKGEVFENRYDGGLAVRSTAARARGADPWELLYSFSRLTLREYRLIANSLGVTKLTGFVPQELGASCNLTRGQGVL